MPNGNSFGSLSTLSVGGKAYTIHKLAAVEDELKDARKLPYSLKILLENLLRNEGVSLAVRKADIVALAQWKPKDEPNVEIAFTPARVLMQDFTGVPCVVDLAAMRDAMKMLGGEPSKINPLVPVELVIDHSVQVDEYGTARAFANNVAMEYERNQERYTFLCWGKNAFNNFKVVPPGTGICHQVNLEYLAKSVFVDSGGHAYPDTLVGTDSHTTMINGLGVLGWGVGGIEAEAAMLGQPVSMLIPQVIGFKLTGRLKEGATATDLVLTVTQMLRKKGVVGKFVEFFGPGLADLPLADRATIANMAPEYGATCGIFPVDTETLRYLTQTGRPQELVALVEAYYKEQGLFHDANTPEATYTDTLELDLATVVPSLAGPTRPQDRIALKDMKEKFAEAKPKLKAGVKKPTTMALPVTPAGEALGGGPAGAFGAKSALEIPRDELEDGSVVIAAITSCTNTSNPSVMVAAGVLAQKAVARGLSTKPWVKTSLAPGSRVVTDYLTKGGLIDALNKLRFNVVGYGCTTCIAAGTPVLLANGTSRRIEHFPAAGGAILFSPTADGRLTAAMQTEVHTKGERDCVALVLQDGRELVCTPDHEILCPDGRWVRADQLVPGEDRVVVGLEAPTDEPGADETGYVLRVGARTFTMSDTHERLRTLAFARLLGHLLGDGSISTRGQGRMNVGQAVDREVLLNDIELLTGKRPAGTQYDERKWSIALPMELTQAIVALPGVRVGRRIDQPPHLPEFVLDENCPVAVVREFLGGVFGADGTAPILKRLGAREEDAILAQPAYSQTARPEHVPELKRVMDQLIDLLGRCGVEAVAARVYEYPVRRAASTYPAAQDGPRVEVRLELPDGLSFAERVGFRYCLDKSLRASAAAVYWRTVDRIHHQRLWMSNRLTELHRERSDLSFSRARELAGTGLHAREAVVFPHYSLLSGLDRFDRLPRLEDRKFRPLHRESCGFPAPVEMLREIGARDWFAPLMSRAETPSEKRYCVEKSAKTFPTLALKVLERRSAGKRRVFDLSVEGVHSFVAGTVGVHNCIGNSGPLPEAVSKEIADGGLVVAAVLSGNRNFEGRIHPEVRANYLASPPLVVAYALAGKVDIDWENDPIGNDGDGKPVYLKDLWPTHEEVSEVIDRSINKESFARIYGSVEEGDARWNELQVPTGDLYAWDASSTYIANPPYFRKMGVMPPAIAEITGARVLALLGDSITTDHISPAGGIKRDSPAGRFLLEHAVEQKDFNQYGARRGHHEVMMRGTFANVRLRNHLIPPREDGSRVEGGFTRHLPGNDVVSIYDAAMAYQKDGVPLIVIGGKEYGSGSSRDWAAKGTLLLGVKAVLAESFERIHRSNLVGMGVVPLQFKPGESAASHKLTGEEVYDIGGLVAGLDKNFDGPTRELTVTAKRPDGTTVAFTALCRIDTPQEVQYYKNGGILPYVLRQLLAAR